MPGKLRIQRDFDDDDDDEYHIVSVSEGKLTIPIPCVRAIPPEAKVMALLATLGPGMKLVARISDNGPLMPYGTKEERDIANEMVKQNPAV